MKTECNSNSFSFQTETSRQVIAQFDGGTITSDGGGLFLREVERLTGILRQFSYCFVDHRDPDLIEHTVAELVSQQIYALALGYEISTIMSNCGPIPCWRPCWAKPIPPGRTACGPRIGAIRWPARVP